MASWAVMASKAEAIAWITVSESLLLSHVGLGFLQRCLGRSLAVCCDLKGRTHSAKVTAHLRDIWHDLAVITGYLQLAQKRVVIGHLLVERNQRWHADRLCVIHSVEPLFGKRVTLKEILGQILVRA